MGVLLKGTDFSTGDQVTATNLDALVDNATFTSDAVDNSTTQLSSGAIIVKDGGLAPAKLTTGAPSWDSNGNTVIKGVNTNSNAASGVVGEYKVSSVAEASAVNVATNTAVNVTTLSLTAGDWDVSAFVSYLAPIFSITTATRIYASISTSSATLGSVDDGSTSWICSIGGNGYSYGVNSPVHRLSLASTTTVYLVAQCTHNGTATDVKAAGTIRARRVR